MRSGIGSCVGSLVGGAAIGAGLMYILDPNRGNARRAKLREKAMRAVHMAQRETNQQLRNAGNHLMGRMRQIKASIRDRASAIDDDILLDRVRAQLGRDVRHLRMLDFSVEDGCVIVAGPALRGEAAKIRRRLRKTRGVSDSDVRVAEVNESDLEHLAGGRGFRPHQAQM